MSSTTAYGDDRNGIIRAQLEDVHGFAIALPGVTPGPGEMALPPRCRVQADAAFTDHAQDLCDFLPRLNVDPRGGDFALRLVRQGEGNRFEADVREDEVVLAAPDVRLMWRAVAWLERSMAARHGPVLPRGRRSITPRFERRITTSMFAHGLESPGDPDAYHDAELRGMAHLGYSSLFLYVNLWTLTHSEIVPELNAADAAGERRRLAELVGRAARHGLDVLLLIAAPRLDADHPAFARLPQLRGGIVMRTEGHALCTSEPLTIRFYAEQMAGLCRDAPGLGGLAFLVGGEGFLHCYTRPVPRTAQVTNCPRCGRHAPSEVLTPLFNGMVAAVNAVSPRTRMIFWPYASHLWTHHGDLSYDWSQDIAVIDGLDRRASWLCEIELHQPFDVPGIGRLSVNDYAIHFIGPSTRLLRIEPELRQRDMEMVVKTECNLDASFHSVPYIPVMQRWVSRHRAIAATDARVVWETWRLNGFWDSPSIEAAFWLDLEPQWSDEQVLRSIAGRLYGPAAAGRVLEAWGLFSDAWERVYRNYGTYWFGPLVIGPAHLFDRGEAIFWPWTYGEGFFEAQAGMRETEKPQVLADPRRRTPRFATSPMPHVPERLRDLGRAAELAGRGVALLEATLAEVPAPLRSTARSDVDVAEITWIILEADVAFHRFIRLRDEARQLSVADPRREELARQAAVVVQGDLDLARQALMIMQRTALIGWGYTFGTRFTESMVREKIQRTTTLLASLQAGSW